MNSKVSFAFPYEGLTGSLFQSKDWSNHPLGSIENWPISLTCLLNVLFHSRNAMCIWWGKELFQFYNDSYLHHLATKKSQEGLGEKAEIYWKETWPSVQTEVKQVLKTGKPIGKKDQLISIVESGQKEETYWTTSYTPLFNGDKIFGVMAMCVETTQQIKAKKQLGESENRLSLALNSGKIGLWDWNAHSGYVFLSDSLMNDWGIDKNKFNHTLQECFERIHPEDRQWVWEEVQKSTFQLQPYDVEYRVVRPGGETIWINAKGRFYVNEKSEPERLSGITINITEKRQAAEELKKAKIEAERANQLKSIFLANMSHEIRTPLGAVLGFAKLIKEASTSEQRAEYAEVIERNGSALTKIIDDILDLSKVESGRLEIEKIEFSIEHLCQEVFKMFTDTALKRNIRLDLELDQNLPFLIKSDPTRIRQILCNLMSNALKFTSEGQVRMKVEFIKAEQKTWLKFSVSDTGVGLTETQQAKLFSPFSQADCSTSRKFGGSGLGLSLSKKLAQALGGDLYLEHAAPREGCTFVAKIEAEIPLKNELYLQSKNNSSQDINLKGIKILHIDDSVDNQNLIKLNLEKLGISLSFANNGLEGYKKALKEDFDLILMDMQMPIMDGFEATAKLRGFGYDRPIVALTAHAMREEQSRTKGIGCDAHLTKPLNVDLLRTVIGKLITTSKLQAKNLH